MNIALEGDNPPQFSEPAIGTAEDSPIKHPSEEGDEGNMFDQPDDHQPLNIHSEPDEKSDLFAPSPEPGVQDSPEKVSEASNTGKDQELNKGFDKSQEESSGKEEIFDKLEIERKKELEEAGEKLKQKMFKQKRCYICTLSFPCKHFKTFEQAFVPEKKLEFQKTGNNQKERKMFTSKTKTNLLSPLRGKPRRVQSKFLKKGDGILPGVGLKAYPEKEHKVQEDKLTHKKLMDEHEQYKGPQKIRIQKGPGKYEVITLQHGMTLADLNQSDKKNKEQKEDRER